MLRRMDDMPVGTLGFEAVGEVEDDDWEDVVEPVLRREIAAGAKVRLLYLIGADARDVDTDAMTADTGFRARHATAFERVAVVSDEAWMKPAVRALSFLMPGRARAFAVHDLPAAKTWLAERDDDGS
jgi:SpoIIAA-like